MAIHTTDGRARWLLACALIALVTSVVVLVVRLPDAPDKVELAPRTDPHAIAVNPPSDTDVRSTPVALVSDSEATASSTTASDGYELHGVVRSRAGAALAGASVHVRIEAPGIAHEVASITSAHDGSYRVALPDLAALEEGMRGLTRVWASASLAGYQEHETPRSIPVRSVDAPEAPVSKQIECDFALMEGNRLRGRVVDARGHPVAQAEVKLWVDSGGAGGKDRVAADEAHTTSSGAFTINFTSGGTYALSAREQATGTAYIADLELSAQADRDLGDLVLQGGGVLAGRLRYPDGSAVQGFELWAVPEAIADEANALAAAARRGAQHERGEGLYYGRATTAHDGAFRFDGLAPGSYALRVAQGTNAVEPHRARYPAGTQDIALSLDSYRLLVHVKNRFGAPLAGAVVSCSQLNSLEDGTLEPAHTTHATAKGATASAAFDVEPDTPFALSASAPGSQTQEEVVLITAGVHELERDLVLEPIGPTGRVRLILPHSSGAPGAVYVGLESAVTKRTLAGVGVLEPDAQGWLPAIAPGRYWVEVGFPSRPDALSFFFPWQSSEPIEVRSDSEQSLVVEPRPGARLEVSLKIRGAAPDFVREERERDGEALGVDDPFLIRCGARVRLVAADGSGERTLQFQIPSHAHPGAVEVSSQILPGSRAMTETLLELGAYVLRVEAPGFRSSERPLDLDRPGVTTLEIDLERE